MNPAELAAGFVFGVIGFWLVRQAKQRGNVEIGIIGMSLMFYSYFVPNPWLSWGIGSALCFLAYRSYQ